METLQPDKKLEVALFGVSDVDRHNSEASIIFGKGGRCYVHAAEVARRDVDVEPPAEFLVEHFALSERMPRHSPRRQERSERMRPPGVK